jgi:hypothetical protein
MHVCQVAPAAPALKAFSQNQVPPPATLVEVASALIASLSGPQCAQWP